MNVFFLFRIIPFQFIIQRNQSGILPIQQSPHGVSEFIFSIFKQCRQHSAQFCCTFIQHNAIFGKKSTNMIYQLRSFH